MEATPQNFVKACAVTDVTRLPPQPSSSDSCCVIESLGRQHVVILAESTQCALNQIPFCTFERVSRLLRLFARPVVVPVAPVLDRCGCEAGSLCNAILCVVKVVRSSMPVSMVVEKFKIQDSLDIDDFDQAADFPEPVTQSARTG